MAAPDLLAAPPVPAPSESFFAMADTTTSIFWIALFFLIVGVMWLIHLKKKQKS
jgi:type II secretory pathway component PulF